MTTAATTRRPTLSRYNNDNYDNIIIIHADIVKPNNCRTPRNDVSCVITGPSVITGDYHDFHRRNRLREIINASAGATTKILKIVFFIFFFVRRCRHTLREHYTRDSFDGRGHMPTWVLRILTSYRYIS